MVTCANAVVQREARGGFVPVPRCQPTAIAHLPSCHRCSSLGHHGGSRQPARPHHTLLRDDAAAHLQPGRERPGPRHRRHAFPPSARHSPAPTDAGPLPAPAATLPAPQQHGGQPPEPALVHQQPAPQHVLHERRGAGSPPEPWGGGKRPPGLPHAAAAASSSALRRFAQQRTRHQWAGGRPNAPQRGGGAGQHERGADAADNRRGEVRVHGPLAPQR